MAFPSFSKKILKKVFPASDDNVCVSFREALFTAQLVPVLSVDRWNFTTARHTCTSFDDNLRRLHSENPIRKLTKSRRERGGKFLPGIITWLQSARAQKFFYLKSLILMNWSINPTCYTFVPAFIECACERIRLIFYSLSTFPSFVFDSISLPEEKSKPSRQGCLRRTQKSVNLSQA